MVEFGTIGTLPGCACDCLIMFLCISLLEFLFLLCIHSFKSLPVRSFISGVKDCWSIFPRKEGSAKMVGELMACPLVFQRMNHRDVTHCTAIAR